MKVQVNGKQIDIGEALSTHVDDRLSASIEKFSFTPTEAEVTFSRDAHMYKCECSVHLSTGLHANASAKEGDIYAACDHAIERLEKQLRRYHRRLKDHHKQRAEPAIGFSAPTYVIEREADEQETEPDTLEPVIIAEMETNIQTLSVGEAVMQMEFTDSPLVIFKNQKSEGLNVVYRRADGNIGWVDPQL